MQVEEIGDGAIDQPVDGIGQRSADAEGEAQTDQRRIGAQPPDAQRHDGHKHDQSQGPDGEAIEQSENEDLVNGLAIAGPFAPPEKQALLEAPTLSDRAAALIALAEMELAGSVKPGSRLQ